MRGPAKEAALPNFASASDLGAYTCCMAVELMPPARPHTPTARDRLKKNAVSFRCSRAAANPSDRPGRRQGPAPVRIQTFNGKPSVEQLDKGVFDRAPGTKSIEADSALVRPCAEVPAAVGVPELCGKYAVAQAAYFGRVEHSDRFRVNSKIGVCEHPASRGGLVRAWAPSAFVRSGLESDRGYSWRPIRAFIPDRSWCSCPTDLSVHVGPKPATRRRNHIADLLLREVTRSHHALRSVLEMYHVPSDEETERMSQVLQPGKKPSVHGTGCVFGARRLTGGRRGSIVFSLICPFVLFMLEMADWK